MEMGLSDFQNFSLFLCFLIIGKEKSEILVFDLLIYFVAEEM